MGDFLYGEFLCIKIYFGITEYQMITTRPFREVLSIA